MYVRPLSIYLRYYNLKSGLIQIESGRILPLPTTTSYRNIDTKAVLGFQEL
jgi:hypothetical protein